MPAKTPPVPETTMARLGVLGERIRAQRKHHRVTAQAAAEAAGMSRVTLHRIERGEPSVTLGAYMNACAALGLELGVIDPQVVLVEERRAEPAAPPELPARIRLAEYPELQRLAWQLHGVTELTPVEALSLFERNWRHVDPARLAPHERELVQALVARLGGARLLV